MLKFRSSFSLNGAPAKFKNAIRNLTTDEDIARAASMKPIMGLMKDKLGIPEDSIIPYGHTKAKLSFDHINDLKDKPDGKLILVTAITPTKAGEGKTTTSVGLVDGLCRLGKKAIVTLREPSLGPVFGMKGGAAGGGYAQVVPMDDINLHFTGDFHAIGASHNLLSAMLDNHIYWDKEPKIDVRRVTWKRVMDMNDRALRDIVCGMGGSANGYPRQDGFDITVASEIMAVFCLANDLQDLEQRISNIVVGYTRGTVKTRKAIRVKDIGAQGAMAALLRDALQPNLVQTLENNPAMIHGGPFANIAHGCNSSIATNSSLKLADYVITEAGFGADLGAEKFFDIKCRKQNLQPACSVLVATVRALKMHGGVSAKELGTENPQAVRDGCSNLKKHITNLRKYGVPVVVGINKFPTDTQAEIDQVHEAAAEADVPCVLSSHWADGGAGAEDLAREVANIVDNQTKSEFKLLYPDDMSLEQKTRTIAQEIYGATDITVHGDAAQMFQQIEDMGYGHFPVCMAKTQYSFSSDPSKVGAPTGHYLPIREVRLAAGAEFVVVLAGDIMTMPGLPKIPSAMSMGVNEKGEIFGLF